jgi:molybdenum cofactor cytidylyltransferase
MPLPIVILAAGASRRLGRPKQLVEFKGETLLGRSIRLANEAGGSPVLVVLGAEFPRICQAVSLADAALVLNDQWQEGIASSIRAGLHALATCAPKAAGMLLMTCDQPRLTAAHLRGLIARFEGVVEPTIVASSYAGTLGTPAIFPRAAFPQLEALRGDKGARSVILKPPCAMMDVNFEGGAIDIDSPADLTELGQ